MYLIDTNKLPSPSGRGVGGEGKNPSEKRVKVNQCSLIVIIKTRQKKQGDKNMNQVINLEINEQKITEIVDNLINNNIHYQENLNRQEMIANVISNFTPQKVADFYSVSEEELTKRVKRVLSLHLVSGMLNDFTPEEMKIFDEAVKRGN
jgi:hypothetical protein